MMTRSRVLFLGSAVIVTSLLCVVVTARFRVSAQTKPPTPLTIVYRNVVYSPAGSTTVVRSNDEIVAVRSDGATLKSNFKPNDKGEFEKAVALNLPGAYYVVDPFTESVASYKQQQPMVSGHNSCGGRPADKVMGYATELITRDDPPDRKITEVVSPDLNCLPIRQETLAQHGDETFLIQRTALTVTVGDPKAEWFRVPASYKERKPSDIQTAHDEKMGHSPRQLAPNFDAAYKSSQKK
jgi:hypothetical protein